jgi:hypothetical protein
MHPEAHDEQMPISIVPQLLLPFRTSLRPCENGMRRRPPTQHPVGLQAFVGLQRSRDGGHPTMGGSRDAPNLLRQVEKVAQIAAPLWWPKRRDSIMYRVTKARVSSHRDWCWPYQGRAATSA